MQISFKEYQKTVKSAPPRKIDENKVPKKCCHQNAQFLVEYKQFQNTKRDSFSADAFPGFVSS